MLPIELLIALLASFITSIGVGLLVIRLFFSPVFESRFFLLGTAFFALYFYSILPTTLLNSVGEAIDPLSLQLFKFSPVLAHFGLFLLMISILLPTIANKYENLFLLILLSMLTIAASIINYQTITFEISSTGFMIISYNSLLSFFLMIANAMAYVIVLIVRIQNVSHILKTKSDGNFQTHHILSLKFFTVHSILVSITIGTLFVTRFLPIGNNMPGLTWFIPLSAIVLYLSYAVFQDESFLFITPARLDAILISDKKSGMSLLTKNFQNDVKVEELLGNLLSAVNISLKINLQSKGNLEQITYGDKVIVTFTGEYITCFLIVTQSNFITASIARYVTKTYEKKFSKKLLDSRKHKIVNANIFRDFEKELDFVRKFIPL